MDIDHSSIAFYRSLTAFLFTSVLILLNGKREKVILPKGNIVSIAVASFFGIFVLYTFEIWAITYASISLVSFFIYSSGIFTLILAAIFLNEKITISKVVASLFVIAGLMIMGQGELYITFSIKGIALALIAGLGYALFLFIVKKNAIDSGLTTMWWLFLFGSIYLSLPYFLNQPQIPDLNVFPYIIFLALIPTLGGFYCTCKALEKIDAGRVQLLEMSEPLFATSLAFIIFNEQLSILHYTGAFFILAGLIYMEKPVGVLSLKK